MAEQTVRIEGTVPVSGTVTSTPSGTQNVSQVGSSTATLTNVASSATSVNLIASNVSAKGRTIYNDSTSVLFIKYGATASATSYTTQLATGAYYEFPIPMYNGAVDGIWTVANGNARVTEW